MDELLVALLHRSRRGPGCWGGSILVVNTLLTDGVESGEDADTRRHEGSVREVLTDRSSIRILGP